MIPSALRLISAYYQIYNEPIFWCIFYYLNMFSKARIESMNIFDVAPNLYAAINFIFYWIEISPSRSNWSMSINVCFQWNFIEMFQFLTTCKAHIVRQLIYNMTFNSLLHVPIQVYTQYKTSTRNVPMKIKHLHSW